MSELTKCNFCTYQAMRRQAREHGHTVVIEMEIFPCEGRMFKPEDVNGNWWITVRYSNQHEPSAMFAALTTECVC